MIDVSRLKHVCGMQIGDFADYGTVEPTPEGDYIFQDCGASVLAVAHLDTVLCSREFSHDHDRVYSTTLDDRLGVYIITELLPALGVRCDVLLTDGEERGCSTAQWFVPPRKYDWMFSFDRAGTDVVMYQYDSPANRRRLGRAGFQIGVGSRSDIAYLDFLGCSGFNFGCGYHHQHRPDCYADLRETEEMVAGFVRFWKRQRNRYLVRSEF